MLTKHAEAPTLLMYFLDNAVPPPVIVQNVDGTQGGLWTHLGYFYVSFLFFILVLLRLV